MTKCHLCGNDAEDWTCRECGEPVCEDCCVPYDHFSQIDYTLCRCCYDGEQSRRSLECLKEEEIKEAKNQKRIHNNKLARGRYWRPENIEKRQLEKERQKKEKKENFDRMFSEAFKIVNSLL